MTTHTSILAWKIPWAEEPDGLQSMGSQSWIWLSTHTCTHTHIHTHWLKAPVLMQHRCSSLLLQLSSQDCRWIHASVSFLPLVIFAYVGPRYVCEIHFYNFPPFPSVVWSWTVPWTLSMPPLTHCQVPLHTLQHWYQLHPKLSFIKNLPLFSCLHRKSYWINIE